MNDTLLADVDENHRNRLRTMLSVDDMIDNVLTRLNKLGMLVWYYATLFT